MPSMKSVMPVKLSLNSKFTFRCHKGIKCFTRCCNDIDILLTPYDVIRIKNRLGISSDEFIARYGKVKIDEKTSHPLLYLKMNEDEERKCPFVTPDGCTIYSDRPANCRYYPVGQGTLQRQGKKGAEEEEFYFFIKEPHCYGFQEKKSWTIASWREDQGVDEYDRVNREWKAIQLRRNLYGQDRPDEKKQLQFFIASYNIDQFRRYVFESNFLRVFDVDDETVERIKNNELELLDFAFRYIKFVMMIEKTMKLKEGAEKYRKRDKSER